MPFGTSWFWCRGLVWQCMSVAAHLLSHSPLLSDISGLSKLEDLGAGHSGSPSYDAHLTCPSTWYRCVHAVQNFSSLFYPAYCLCVRVFICKVHESVCVCTWHPHSYPWGCCGEVKRYRSHQLLFRSLSSRLCWEDHYAEQRAFSVSRSRPRIGHPEELVSCARVLSPSWTAPGFPFSVGKRWNVLCQIVFELSALNFSFWSWLWGVLLRKTHSWVWWQVQWFVLAN